MIAWQAATGERGDAAAIDARHRHAAIATRRAAVASGRTPDIVITRAGAIRPRCASFPAGERPGTIPLGQNHVATL